MNQITTAPPAEFFGLYYSPWTVKAKWALDYCKVPYTYHEHLMIFGMPHLRCKMRRPFGDLNLPAMVAGNERLDDSFKIAKYAHRQKPEIGLFPNGSDARIAEINALSERALSAGRAILLYNYFGKGPFYKSEIKAARLASLPKFIPAPLKVAALPLVTLALDYVRKGFATTARPRANHRAVLRGCLLEMRVLLNGRKTVLDTFSYADLALAVVLQFASPADTRFIPLSKALRTIWGDVELAREFADLVQWRDELLKTHLSSKLISPTL